MVTRNRIPLLLLLAAIALSSAPACSKPAPPPAELQGRWTTSSLVAHKLSIDAHGITTDVGLDKGVLKFKKTRVQGEEFVVEDSALKVTTALVNKEPVESTCRGSVKVAGKVLYVTMAGSSHCDALSGNYKSETIAEQCERAVDVVSKGMTRLEKAANLPDASQQEKVRAFTEVAEGVAESLSKLPPAVPALQKLVTKHSDAFTKCAALGKEAVAAPKDEAVMKRFQESLKAIKTTKDELAEYCSD